MNTFKYFLLLLLVTFAISLHGDIIISKDSPAETYVGINNLEEYPDFEIIGCIEGFGFPNKRLRVSKFSSWKSFYLRKSCSITFYAIKKKYLNKKDINKIDWKNDKHVIKSNLKFKAKSYTMMEAVRSMNIKFSIAGFIDKSIVLYKSQEICKYKNGKSETVNNFKYKGDLSKLKKRP